MCGVYSGREGAPYIIPRYLHYAYIYLRMTIICRYIFLQYRFKAYFACTYTVQRETLARFLIWQLIAKLKTHQLKLNACVPMTVSIQIAKFKFQQYQLKAVSSNLMLAKVTCYTVVCNLYMKMVKGRQIL